MGFSRNEELVQNLEEGRGILSVINDCGLSLPEEALADLLQAVVNQGARFKLRAKGFSMAPFIRDGDLITISSGTAASPGLGDVVAFIHPAIKRVFIHRVIGKEGDAYLTKGDNSQEMDGPVPAAKILGFVNRVDRDNKRIMLGLGPERFLIAFLTRRNLFRPLMGPLHRIIHPLKSIHI